MNTHDAKVYSNSIESSLWDFALELYSEEYVKQQCLDLQNRYQANINIMLWCCWLDVVRVRLSVDVMDDVRATIDSISLQTVAKLREVRQVLVDSGAFTKVQASLIKKRILSAELMIEKILLQKLQDLTSKYLESNKYQADSGSHSLDIESYLQQLQVPDAGNRAAMLRAYYQQFFSGRV